VKIPKTAVPEEQRVLEARCAVVGQSRNIKIDRVIYVVPEVYGHLPLRDRYDVAKVLGQINQACSKEESILLIGPGRWGTSSPELGIPVSFPDINRTSVICELVMMRNDFVPDVSLGTHFLNELVEQEMLYLALFPHQEATLFNRKFFEDTPSTLLKIIPSASSWQNVIRVLDTGGHAYSHKKRPLLRLAADSMEQRVLCWLDTHSGTHQHRSHK
jgi:pyruvate, water dikinase